jgi:murein L,D-transpeptidase YafK
MLFRVTVSTFLIVVGIASPWLVRDWLDWRADERAANRLYDAVTALPETIRGSNSRVEKEDVAVETVPDDGSDSIEKSLPVASATVRILKGFLPASLGSSAGTRNSMVGLSAVPATTKSNAVTEATREELKGKLERLGLEMGDAVYLRAFKEEKELEVWMRAEGENDFSLFRVYGISDLAGNLGPKQREGDGQAPEGFYYVSRSGMRPDTRHHLGFDLGYPNEFDRSLGRSGSDMLFHSGGRAAGSFALSREDMNEVYTLADAALRNGHDFFRVNIFPFRMTDARMEAEWKRQPKWISFWTNLKEGYDFFENVKAPPDVGASAGEYTFRIR